MSISRELLSEVLGCKLDIDEQLQPNDIEYIEKVGSKLYYRYINIYELQNKCKEWANSVGWDVESSTSNLGDNIPYAIPTYIDNWCIHNSHAAKSEPEAVFLACQWILENKDK
jgi:hypothetical protein